jgi:hypothetical protein
MRRRVLAGTDGQAVEQYARLESAPAVAILRIFVSSAHVMRDLANSRRTSALLTPVYVNAEDKPPPIRHLNAFAALVMVASLHHHIFGRSPFLENTLAG